MDPRTNWSYQLEKWKICIDYISHHSPSLCGKSLEINMLDSTCDSIGEMVSV